MPIRLSFKNSYSNTIIAFLTITQNGAEITAPFYTPISHYTSTFPGSAISFYFDVMSSTRVMTSDGAFIRDEAAPITVVPADSSWLTINRVTDMSDVIAPGIWRVSFSLAALSSGGSRSQYIDIYSSEASDTPLFNYQIIQIPTTSMPSPTGDMTIELESKNGDVITTGSNIAVVTEPSDEGSLYATTTWTGGSNVTEFSSYNITPFDWIIPTDTNTSSPLNSDITVSYNNTGITRRGFVVIQAQGSFATGYIIITQNG